MKKQPACREIARPNMLGCALKIEARLLLCPGRAARRQHLQPKIVIRFSVAGVTAGMPGALLEKNRFDTLLKKFKVENRLRPSCRTSVSSRGGFLNPGRNHFPFGVILSFTELAPAMKRVTTSFVGERVQQQMAMKGIPSNNEFRDNLEILP